VAITTAPIALDVVPTAVADIVLNSKTRPNISYSSYKLASCDIQGNIVPFPGFTGSVVVEKLVEDIISIMYSL
jgi:hypothetical protein